MPEQHALYRPGVAVISPTGVRMMVSDAGVRHQTVCIKVDGYAVDVIRDEVKCRWVDGTGAHEMWMAIEDLRLQ